MLAALVAVGAVIAVVFVALADDSSDDDKNKKRPSESSASSRPEPTPTLSVPSIPSQIPTRLPTDFPTDLPSGLPSLPSGFPSSLPSGLEPGDASPVGDEVPYYLLTRGDCFNISDGRPGRAVKRSCAEPHDAELVTVAELTGSYATDESLKKAASALCERPLARKAEQQPSGTVRGTLVQYPDTTGYRIGIDNVACSLAADDGTGERKLTHSLK